MTYEFDPNDPYAAILLIKIEERCNGYLNAEAVLAEFKAWCDKHRPLTRDIYDRLADEQKAAIPRFGGWAPFGDHIEFPSGGVAKKAYRAMSKLAKHKAFLQARDERIAAGWSDPNEGNPRVDQSKLKYLVDPDGDDEVGNGQGYEDWAGPYDYLVKDGMYGNRFLI